MIIFVNEKNEIKGVGATSDSTLTPHEINDDMNPFNGMSEAKICCYKATVIGGRVTMMTPYVDSRLLDHFDQVGNQIQETQTSISGEYDNKHIYSKDEYCTYLGNLYKFTADKARGVIPTNENHWKKCNIAEELNYILSILKE